VTTPPQSNSTGTKEDKPEKYDKYWPYGYDFDWWNYYSNGSYLTLW
jgi:hypothetical protein